MKQKRSTERKNKKQGIRQPLSGFLIRAVVAGGDKCWDSVLGKYERCEVRSTKMVRTSRTSYKYEHNFVRQWRDTNTTTRRHRSRTKYEVLKVLILYYILQVCSFKLSYLPTQLGFGDGRGVRPAPQKEERARTIFIPTPICSDTSLQIRSGSSQPLWPV